MGGRQLKEVIWTFVAAVQSQQRTHPVVATMAAVLSLAKFRSAGSEEKQKKSAAFHISYSVVRYVKYYSSRSNSQVKTFLEYAQLGKLIGKKCSVNDSPGIRRMSSSNKNLVPDLALFLQGLVSYLCHEEVTTETAEDRCKEFLDPENEALLMGYQESTLEFKDR